MHEVLEDADLSFAVTLLHEDGTATATRGVIGQQPEGVGDIDAPSRLSCWVPTPASVSRVAQLRLERTLGTEDLYRILGIEPVAGALYDTTEFSVRFVSGQSALGQQDFAASDFAIADFA